ncbi:MAG TPA: glycosyltransferase family 2 protein [Bryobacteraceae bacterium]|nr:glycosyltransferase family 2 protein [Bryobacteraceae bacterium]
MKLSVVIPARDEEGSIEQTVAEVAQALTGEQIPFEIVVVDDGSSDQTARSVLEFAQRCAGVRLVSNNGPHGFGLAVRAGLAQAAGEAIAVMMADGSDSPRDLVQYYRKVQAGYDCAFGSRFIHGSRIVDYPVHKLAINRMANWFIRILFGLRYNDITNAFKCYKRSAIDGMQPLISPHFNLTVEMPLKAIVRGYTYAVVPISWTNRKSGMSKLKIKEMGSRYLFIVLYLWLERHLSRGDYLRRREQTEENAAAMSRNSAST